jgi:hypothetical protein
MSSEARIFGEQNERRGEPRNKRRVEPRVSVELSCKMSFESSRRIGCKMSIESSCEMTVESIRQMAIRSRLLSKLSHEVSVEVEPRTQAGTLYFDWFFYYYFVFCFYNGLFRLTHRMHGHWDDCMKISFAAHPLFSWSLGCLSFGPLDEGMGINGTFFAR